jgi:hypothetical protein
MVVNLSQEEEVRRWGREGEGEREREREMRDLVLNFKVLLW